MTTAHATPITASHAEDIAEHLALQLLSYEQLKKLRSTSRSIRSLGFLWGFSGLAAVYIGAMMVSSSEGDNALGLLLVPYGLVVAVVGPYCAWARPGWGRVVCMLLSVGSLGNIPYGTLLGILSLIALGSAKSLFGDNKIAHKDVEAAFKARNG